MIKQVANKQRRLRLSLTFQPGGRLRDTTSLDLLLMQSLLFLMFRRESLGKFDQKTLTDTEAILPGIIYYGRATNTKVMVALGGATDYGFLDLMTAIGESGDTDLLLDHAVQQVVNFVRE